MKLITTCANFSIGLGIGLVSFSLSAVLRIRYKQASHRVLSHVFHPAHQAIKLEISRLDKKQFPRVIQDYLGIAFTKILAVREDKCEKNFTHNELFTLQKRFLDNCIALNNSYQGVCLFPRLAPHVSDYQEPTKTLTVRDDKCEKNFTHNELFTLQKRFLDNFMTPNNAYQMVHLVPHLAPKDFPNEDRKTENLRWERKSGLICSNESKTWNTIQSSIQT